MLRTKLCKLYMEIINKIIIVGCDTRGTVMMGAMIPQERGDKGGIQGKPMSFS
jgi:hypothetical protein